MLVGILSLQGAVEPHRDMLARLGVASTEVRVPAELDAVDALVVPGGESTAISKLLEANDLTEPLQRRLDAGMPAFGTCAGMILLAREVLDGRPDQRSFAAIDVAVRRNAFGRQVDSFETDLAVRGLDAPVHAVFIRAPVVERVGDGVEVLAEVDGRPVCCRQGRVVVTAFHPELSGDPRLHELFLATFDAGTARRAG
ncbi:MAG TPA: pyridoxal 5'-phosphate synthase glutaminase subunit PdxT [Acidimicrobiales bacterium]|nr:pyridoxal 5'-phosphate synthase glutaminase subunit PdxT [Acidimicrobiales bacterium]